MRCLSLTALVLTVPTLHAQTADLDRSVRGLTWQGGDGLWVHEEGSAQSWLALVDATTRPLHLAGVEARARLLLDRPRSLADVAAIGLPEGGALHGVDLPGAVIGIVHLRPGGEPRLVLASTTLGDEVAVRADGRRALLVDGASLVLLNLGRDEVVRTIPLPVTPEAGSLRLGQRVAWFVAQDELWRVPLTGTPGMIDLGTEPTIAELVLASEADTVLAMTREDDGKLQPFVVDRSGSAMSLDDFQHYSAPSLEHPLGPFAALSPDGSLVALREAKDDEHELYVVPVGQGGRQHVTQEAHFADYIDSVGVLAFGGPTTLCFFGGDQKHGEFTADDALGAADMYACELESVFQPVIVNVTRTSGESLPPFEAFAQLEFVEAVVGPLGERIYLIGVDGDGAQHLSQFRIDGGDDLLSVNHAGVLEQLGAAPTLLTSQAGLLAVGDQLEPWPTHGQSDGKVECAGVGLVANTPVRVLATDKDDPLYGGAKVWFDGVLQVGDSFAADAAAWGADHLGSSIYVHLLDPVTDASIQTVELHTSCSQPLMLGDRYGALRLIGALGENAGDACAGEGRPKTLTLALAGGGCDQTQNEQGGDDDCGGDPVEGAAWVRASNNPSGDANDADIWFEGWVPLGASFVVDSAAAGQPRLEDETFLHLFDGPTGAVIQQLEIRTSCSKPILVGDRFGALVVADWSLDLPPDPNDACAAGRPVQLIFQLLEAGCERVSLGTVAQAVGGVDQPMPSSTDLEPGHVCLGALGDGQGEDFGLLLVGLDGAPALWRLDGSGAVRWTQSVTGAAPSLAFTDAGRLAIGRQVSVEHHELILFDLLGGASTIAVDADALVPLHD